MYFIINLTLKPFWHSVMMSVPFEMWYSKIVTMTISRPMVPVSIRAIFSSSRDFRCFSVPNRRTKSTVTMVEIELAPESIVDIAAANKAATTIPEWS